MGCSIKYRRSYIWYLIICVDQMSSATMHASKSHINKMGLCNQLFHVVVNLQVVY
jgi:hypothetical protein